MEKLNQLIEKYGIKVLLVLALLGYMKSCGTGSEVAKLKKEVKAQQEVINALPTSKDVKIEGLKAEKRMIQATDRKMLDVQRQTEIEKEIAALEADTTK